MLEKLKNSKLLFLFLNSYIFWIEKIKSNLMSVALKNKQWISRSNENYQPLDWNKQSIFII